MIHFRYSKKHKEPPIKVEQVKTAIGPSLTQRSLGSVSESATPITSGLQSQNIPTNILSDKEYSLWLQWTISQCTWTMVAGHPGTQTKLTFLFEDASASIDQQEAYTKLKFRIRSITGKHFVENNVGDFAPRSFPGRIISCQPDLLKTIYAFSPESAAVEILSEDDDVPVNCLSKGVFNMTITKAECQNVIRKLKSSSKNQILTFGNRKQKRINSETKNVLTKSFRCRESKCNFSSEESKYKFINHYGSRHRRVDVLIEKAAKNFLKSSNNGENDDRGSLSKVRCLWIEI